jgi:hypothetical protein
MKSAFRFRLYPDRGQEAMMRRALETTRRLCTITIFTPRKVPYRPCSSRSDQSLPPRKIS